MPQSSSRPRASASRYASDGARWQAILDRDPRADGEFYYSVRTTGVYCRVTCPARRPRRENVRFHATCQAAERAGFRPCKRCQPTQTGLAERHALAVAKVCRMLESAEPTPQLDALAAAAKMSPFHLHRLFKKETGMTPKMYARVRRMERAAEALLRGGKVTEAIHAAGFQSSSRFYAQSRSRLGMHAKSLRDGAANIPIQFACADCWLGCVLVARTPSGICAILLGDDRQSLARELRERFPLARITRAAASFRRQMDAVVKFLDEPARGLKLPLDIQGTAFQQRVWSALRDLRAGSTASYAEIAERIGQPKSTRAVASACAANTLAVAIPCHRVLRGDGSLAGYRWGVERKRELIRRERAAD